MKKHVLFLITVCMLGLSSVAFAAGPGNVDTHLQLWLKADDNGGVTTDGANVSSWVDVSGNNNNGTAIGSPDYHENSINFHPIITLDGSSDGFNLPNGTLSINDDNYDYYAVFKTPLSQNLNTLFFSGTNAQNKWVRVHVDSDGSVDDRFNVAGVLNGNPGKVLANTPALANTWYDTTLDKKSIYISGIADKELANVADKSTTDSNHSVGYNASTNGNYFEGDIAELVAYNASNSDSDRRKITSYLALKYGITLGHNGTNDNDPRNFYLDGQGNQIYSIQAYQFRNNIIGIGKDTNTSLDQRISRSQSAELTPVLTISTDSNFVAENDTHIDALTDGQYLVMGARGTTANPNDVQSTGNVNFSQRIKRDWRMENTGNISSVHMKFDGFDQYWHVFRTKPGTINNYTEGVDLGALDSNGEITLNTLDSGMVFTLARETVFATIDDVSVNEGDGTATFTITIDKAIPGGFTLDISTSDGTATAGSDYTAISNQQVTFVGNAGEQQTVTVTINDDADIESNESFTVSMSNASSVFVDISDIATGTILDNDAVSVTPGGVNSNLALWLRADDNGTTNVDGTTVSSWVDKSSNTYSLSANDTPELKVNTLNFNPTILYQGNDRHIFANADDVNVQNSTVFAVGMPRTTSGGYGAEFWTTDGGGANEDDVNADVVIYRSAFNSPGHIIYYDNRPNNASDAYRQSGEHWASGFPNIVRASFENAMPYDASYTKDGETTQTITDANQLSYNAGSPVINYTYKSLGNWVNNNYAEPFGHIAETIIYQNGAMSAADVNKVESYLALKYGITLDQSTATPYVSSGGTKMWDETISTAYNHDIFGIGNDSGSELDQRVSKSINPDAIVTISTTNDFTSANEDAGRVSLNNGQFITIANNNGSAAYNTSIAAPDGYKVLDRMWRYQNVGSVASAYMQFDVHDTDFDVPAAETNYYIIVDTNGNGDLSDETPQQLDANNSAQVSLNTGAIFALATELQAPNEGNQTLSPNPPAVVTGPGPITAGGSCGADYANGTVEFTTNPAGILNPNPTVVNLDANGDYSNVSLTTVDPITTNFDVIITCITPGGTKGPIVTKGTFEYNQAPTITSDGAGATAAISVAENTTAVTTVTSTDPNIGDTATYSITGGDDSAQFTIDASTGILTFITAPDYENPTDIDGNNTYLVVVTVTDAGGLTDTQTITVTVTDENDTRHRRSSKVRKNPKESFSYVCKDPKALNYQKKGIHKQGLCKYEDKEEKGDEGSDEEINKGEKGLGEGETCPSSMWLHDNMKKGDRNGKYSAYNRGTVTEVKLLQAHMNRLGFRSGPEDGIFGTLTDKAVKRMQKFLGTRQDGIVGPITRSLINHSCAKEEPVIEEEPALQEEINFETAQCPHFTKYFKTGEKDSEIGKIQAFLLKQGFNPGGVDYTMGPKTISAIKAFQTKYADDILKPWGLTKATGRWYKSTRFKANALVGCHEDSVRLDNGKTLH